MPTPFEVLINPVSLTVFAIYAALMLWEALAPARALPRVAGWRARGLGALAGLAVYEAGVYAWHRTMHAVDPLWRAFHQLHHSAERVDTYGAFWFSPLDILGWTLLSSLCLTLVVGVTAEAAVIVLYVTTFLAVFQHANVRTPRWLGFVVQRPESHSYHHERGVHARNYSDLPIFDLVFGTFYNPPGFAPATGFYDGASRRLGTMLAMRDVAAPAAGRHRVAAPPAGAG